jgi:hypothetical protein
LTGTCRFVPAARHGARPTYWRHDIQARQKSVPLPSAPVSCPSKFRLLLIWIKFRLIVLAILLRIIIIYIKIAFRIFRTNPKGKKNEIHQ